MNKKVCNNIKKFKNKLQTIIPEPNKVEERSDEESDNSTSDEDTVQEESEAE